jgi:hypothetical protein
MIKGICHTNLDAYRREEWPNTFIIVPNRGDNVESSSGNILKIVSITHCIAKNDFTLPKIKCGDPFLRIELHNGGNSI